MTKLKTPVLSSSKFYDNSIATDGTVELLQALAASEVLGALQLARHPHHHHLTICKSGSQHYSHHRNKTIHKLHRTSITTITTIFTRSSAPQPWYKVLLSTSAQVVLQAAAAPQGRAKIYSWAILVSFVFQINKLTKLFQQSFVWFLGYCMSWWYG